MTSLSAGALYLHGQDDGNLSRGMITPPAQDAINAGMDYLDRQQGPDGSWGTNVWRGSVAITSLCGLAFMAGGHQPGRGRFGRAVTRAIEYVVSREDPTIPGYLQNRGAVLQEAMYSHGFATLFLAEAHGMVSDARLRVRLRGVLGRAVQLIIDAQNREGGWRYRPVPADADLSVTICQIMALRAARNAGLAVPKSVADRCTKYVEECQDIHGSGGFRYQRGRGPVGFARTAAGVVALYSAGKYDGDSVKKGLEYLVKEYRPGNERLPFRDGDSRNHFFYGHYYAAQAMWIAGGTYWRTWFPTIRDELVRGSYHQADGCWYDSHSCRHFCTAMALIILQIPNNYLPIMQR